MRLQRNWEGCTNVRQLEESKIANPLVTFAGEKEVGKNRLGIDVGGMRAEEAALVIVAHLKKVIWGNAKMAEPTVKYEVFTPEAKSGDWV